MGWEDLPVPDSPPQFAAPTSSARVRGWEDLPVPDTESTFAQADDDEKTSKLRVILASMVAGPTHPGAAASNAVSEMVQQTGGDPGKTVALGRRTAGLVANVATDFGVAAAMGPVLIAELGSGNLPAFMATNAALSVPGSMVNAMISGEDYEGSVKMVKDQAAAAGLFSGVLKGGFEAFKAVGKHVTGKLGAALVEGAARQPLTDTATIAAELDAADPIAPVTAELANLEKVSTRLAEQVKDLIRRGIPRGRSITKDLFDKNPRLRAHVIDVLKKDGHLSEAYLNDPNINEFAYELGKELRILPKRLINSRASIGANLADDFEGRALGAARGAFGPDNVPGKILPASEYKSARQAAFRAAKEVAKEEFDEVTGAGRLLEEDVRLSNLRLGHLPYSELGRNVFWQWGKAASSMLRSSKHFGEAGRALADGIDKHLIIQERAVGNWVNWAREELQLHKLSSAELEVFDKAMRGKLRVADQTPKMQAMVAKGRELLDNVADDARHIRQVDRRATSELKAELRDLAPTQLRKAVDTIKKALTDEEVFAKLPDRYKVLVRQYRTVGAQIYSSGRQGLLVHVGFRRGMDYAPRYMKPEILEALRKGDASVVRRLFEAARQAEPTLTKQAFKARLAELADSAGSPFAFRGGSLQWSRELPNIPEEFFVTDPRIWLEKYLHDSGQRIAASRVWGPLDENFDKIAELLKHQAGSTKEFVGGEAHLPWVRETAEDIFRAVNGRPAATPQTVKLARNVVSTTLLGLRTTALQYLQLQNAATAFGFRKTLKAAISLAADPRLRNLARDVGAILPDAPNMALLEEVDTAVSNLPHIRLIRAADASTRHVAATAAQLRAVEAGREVVALGAKGPAGAKAAIAARDLKRLGMNPQEVLENGGNLSGEMLKTAGLQGSNMTMFTNHVNDLPIAQQTPLGKFALLLKRFAYQHSRFVKNYVVAEARQGNLQPALRFMAAVGVGDATAAKVIEALSDPDGTGVEDQMQALTITQLLGLIGDAATMAAEGDYSKAAQTLGGPVASAAANIGIGSAETVIGAVTLDGDKFQSGLWHLTPNSVKQAVYLGKRLTR